MSSVPIKISSFAATTSGTVALTYPNFVPNVGAGGFGNNIWMEVTGISTGSALTTSGASFKWQSAGGNALVVAAISAVLVTSTTNSQMLTFAAGFVDATKRIAPPLTHVQLTFQTTSTSNGVTGDLYLIPATYP